jgi:hypothetical protein
VRRTARVSTLPIQLRAQVVSLRKTGMNVMDICARLGIEKSSERNAVSQLCADPALRRFQVGIESGPHSSPHKIRTGNWA